MSDQTGADQAEVEAEINQLKDENEKQHAELNEANDKLKAAEAKAVELENELEAMREAQAAPSPSEPIEAKITPPERTASELLVVEWFFTKFIEKSEVENYIISLVFNTDGTGSQRQTFYLPADG